jgi:hypothetical protein
MLLKRKEIFTVIFFMLLLSVLTYVFCLNGQFTAYYIVILPVILFLVSLNKEFIIVLYLVLLPTAGIISSEENILEAFGLDEFINIIAIGYFLSSKQAKNKLNLVQNNARGFVILMIIIVCLTNFKNAFFDIYGGEFFLVLKRGLFLTIKYLPLLYIIRRIKHFRIKQHAILGMYIGAVIIVISQIFNESLFALNLVTFDDSEFAGLAANIEKVNRFSGFYNGDPNSAGIFLLMIIGFIFIEIEKFKNLRKYLYPLVLFLCYGILMTASRTVIVAFALVTLIFAYNNRVNKLSIQIYFLYFLGVIFAFDFVANQLSRFHNAHLQTSADVDGNRIMKWVYYINFMIESPIYLITGSQEEINNRAAHNVYIQMLYNVGLLPVIIFIAKTKNSIKLLYSKNKKAIYFIIPFISITMYVGELKEVPIYILLFTLTLFDNYEKNKINEKSISNRY